MIKKSRIVIEIIKTGIRLPLRKTGFYAITLLLSLCAVHSSGATGVALVVNSQPASTIVVAEEAPELTTEAAEKLSYYIREITGAEPAIVHSLQEVKTKGILWVGPHPAMAARYPTVDFTLNDPEEILIRTLGNDVVILGHDTITEDGIQFEAGTHLAVSSFIENQLGVRWFWPGKWGTDIPQQTTLRIQPVSIRYSPQLRLRSLSLPSFERRLDRDIIRTLNKHVENPKDWAAQKDKDTREWQNHHRGDSRSTGAPRINPLAGNWSDFHNAHAFRWGQYRKEHPEWFAMQPDGSRQEDTDTPYPDAQNVKICVSNPGVAEKWLEEAREYFTNNPHATTFSASERDKGWQGYCLCKDCLAMDNPGAEILEREIRWEHESRLFYALTDRYAKFWNTIARRLKEDFPDRDVNVSVYAYHVTRPAPTIKLEDNVIPIFVGLERRLYQRNSEEHTLDQRRMWKEWWEAAEKRNVLVWRPNMMYRNIGLPYIFTRRHAENMRFMAEHGLVGVITDSGISASNWSTQGPQLYLAAKLLWDPYADAETILADYYQRAFGPAAPYIEQYFQLFEDLYIRLAEQYKDRGYATYQDPPRLFREIRLDSRPSTGRLGEEGIARHRVIEDQAQEFLQKAEDSVANSDQKYQERVAFVKAGFQFIQAHLDCIEAMNDFRKTSSTENRERIIQAVARRAEILNANVDNFAFNQIALLQEILRRPQDLGSSKIVTVQETKDQQQELLHELEQ